MYALEHPCFLGSAPTTPALTTTIAPQEARLLIFVLALVISLVLGVLGTGLGIFCWRKKKRNRQTEERSGDDSKNYITSDATYHRHGVMPDMVVELPGLQKPDVPNHYYHTLEDHQGHAVLMDHTVGMECHLPVAVYDGYEPICNTYDKLEDYCPEAKPVPKPRFQGRAESRMSSAQNNNR